VVGGGEGEIGILAFFSKRINQLCIGRLLWLCQEKKHVIGRLRKRVERAPKKAKHCTKRLDELQRKSAATPAEGEKRKSPEIPTTKE